MGRGKKKQLVAQQAAKKTSVEAASPIKARLRESVQALDSSFEGEDSVGDIFLDSSMATEVNELSAIFVSIESCHLSSLA